MTSKPRNQTKPAECKVADCNRQPARDGLCGIHWDTHRGLATPTTEVKAR